LSRCSTHTVGRGGTTGVLDQGMLKRERERDGSQQRPRGSDGRGAMLRKHSETWDRKTPGDRTKTGRRRIVGTEIRQNSVYTRKQVITKDGLHGGCEMGTCREAYGCPVEQVRPLES
jgi:hypothetical protein